MLVELYIKQKKYNDHLKKEKHSQNNPILSITINDTDCKTKEDLRFHLTNKFFNEIHKDYNKTFEILNYLFVIEYPTKVSMETKFLIIVMFIPTLF